MQKNREKFLVIKSGGFFGLWLQERENAGKGGGKWYNESEKCIIKSRIEFPNINDFRHPTWTYHKVSEKMPKKCVFH